MATTCVENEGEITLPESVVRQMGVRQGDVVDVRNVRIDGSQIILTFQTRPRAVARVVNDPETGYPVIDFEGDDLPVLTSQQVADILADFP